MHLFYPQLVDKGCSSLASSDDKTYASCLPVVGLNVEFSYPGCPSLIQYSQVVRVLGLPDDAVYL